MPRITIRPLAARDSFAELTTLVHEAYAPLAAQGMNFTAAVQDEATTRRRAAEGQCFVAEEDGAVEDGAVLGTVTVCGPYDLATAQWAVDAPWFRDRDTAHFHQFAVAPAHQRRGVGRRLIAACEQWARSGGFKHMALDTALPAVDLRNLYKRLGYTDVGQVQWQGKTYRSVIMQKALHHSALHNQFSTLARYNLWATNRLLKQVSALPEADYCKNAGQFFGSVHGTLNHLAVAQQLWFTRFAEGKSLVLALDAEVEPDRQRLRLRLQEGALAWLPLIETWSEAHLTGQLNYTTTKGQALSLPFAATLAHVFNHGTHHRGQITAALTAMGHPCPVLDLVYMLVEESTE
jgi:uncharacterized damage-inducible protein DinB/GNAT superfamily N-acetyltransferase